MRVSGWRMLAAMASDEACLRCLILLYAMADNSSFSLHTLSLLRRALSEKNELLQASSLTCRLTLGRHPWQVLLALPKQHRAAWAA